MLELRWRFWAFNYIWSVRLDLEVTAPIYSSNDSRCESRDLHTLLNSWCSWMVSGCLLLVTDEDLCVMHLHGFAAVRPLVTTFICFLVVSGCQTSVGPRPRWDPDLGGTQTSAGPDLG